jgi:DNA polymerase-3 subunit alpha
VSDDRKKNMSGQMSLFDFVAEEDKASFEITLPDLEEYSKEERLALEKEVLGIYVSGHPLDEYEEKMRKNITATTKDFIADEEGIVMVNDNQSVTVGGMIMAVTVKYTKTGKPMAFVTLEDLFGTLEIVVFPNMYERYRSSLVVDKKIFVMGKVSLGDDEQGKLICDRIIEFSKLPRELWIQFQNKAEYFEKEKELLGILESSEGSDRVIIYLKEEKAKKILPAGWEVLANTVLLEALGQKFGDNNVKVVEKNIENKSKMH